MNMLIKLLQERHTTDRMGNPIFQGNGIIDCDILPIEIPDEVWNLDYPLYIIETAVTPRYFIDEKSGLIIDEDGNYGDTGFNTVIHKYIDNSCNETGYADSRFTRDFIYEFTFIGMDVSYVQQELASLIKEYGSLKRVLTYFCLICK